MITLKGLMGTTLLDPQEVVGLEEYPENVVVYLRGGAELHLSCTLREVLEKLGLRLSISNSKVSEQ